MKRLKAEKEAGTEKLKQLEVDKVSDDNLILVLVIIVKCVKRG